MGLQIDFWSERQFEGPPTALGKLDTRVDNHGPTPTRSVSSFLQLLSKQWHPKSAKRLHRSARKGLKIKKKGSVYRKSLVRIGLLLLRSSRSGQTPSIFEPRCAVEPGWTSPFPRRLQRDNLQTGEAQWTKRTATRSIWKREQELLYCKRCEQVVFRAVFQHSQALSFVQTAETCFAIHLQHTGRESLSWHGTRKPDHSTESQHSQNKSNYLKNNRVFTFGGLSQMGWEADWLEVPPDSPAFLDCRLLPRRQPCCFCALDAE